MFDKSKDFYVAQLTGLDIFFYILINYKLKL